MASTLRRPLHRMIRWARGLLDPRPIILMYHRVVDVPFDPQLLAVSPRHFAEHLEVLRARFQPLSLSQLVGMLGSRRLPYRGVVVTMDDGYADNLAIAKPLLEAQEIPATAFIASGYLDATREFWWDELERLVFSPNPLPPVIEVSAGSAVRRWVLDVEAQDPYLADEEDRSWNVEMPGDPGARHQLYRSMYDWLHPLPGEATSGALERLRYLVGEEPGPRDSHRILTTEELQRLPEGGLIEVGAHSVTHPALAGLQLGEQRDEVRKSRAALEDILGAPVRSFAFPHGSYSSATLETVRGAGFTSACTSDPALVGRGNDRFRLPRFVPRDWDGDTFGRWLHSIVG
jgi:peptidoglycan/xylan/chitin deacetylase (PgdA/CDA1 family)